MLFSRPDSPTRWNMTVSVSYDEGSSLRYSRTINPNRSYYSDLARLSDGTIVLLYGCDGDIPSAPLRVTIWPGSTSSGSPRAATAWPKAPVVGEDLRPR